ncbi:hypothetical protein Tco_0954653 [Tanacetum coccineum]|uniref:Uncharacterized protein n=1 Tax=Tanacetum coccineum TaxID=301880 RepID=A0ABQ5E516_9ASTR
MLDSKAYKDYYAVASGVEPPKAKTKYKKKSDEHVTPSKSKTAPASKGYRHKSPAKVAKSDKKKQPATMQKTKGLAVLFEVALTEAEQIKLATKKSKTQFHSSHASGSGDGVDTQSKVPDEQQQKDSGTNEGADEEDADEETDVNDDSDETGSDNDGDDLTHPNLVSTLLEYELTEEEEENKKGDDKDKESEHEQDDKDDLYKDVDINLERSDAEMTDAQANKYTEDAHATLTVVPPIVQQQSSSVSSDLVSKFINPSPDTGIVDNYLASKMKEALDVVVQLQTNKLREEAQVENHEYLNQVDSTMKAIIKEQTSYAVAASLSEFKLKRILINKMETNKSIDRSDVQKDLYKALVESYNSDKDIISSYGDVVTLKRSRDDQDKDEDPSARSNRGSKRRRSGKEAESSKEPTHKESKSTSSSKGATRSQPKSFDKSAHAVEHGQKVDDLEDQSYKEFNTGNDDETSTREALDDDES